MKTSWGGLYQNVHNWVEEHRDPEADLSEEEDQLKKHFLGTIVEEGVEESGDWSLQQLSLQQDTKWSLKKP